MPYDFEVDWSESSTGYSSELEKTYYEFPVTWENSVEPFVRPDHKNKSDITYKILAVEGGEYSVDFYVLKFMAPADSSIKDDISFSNLSDFTGHVNVYNRQNERVLAQKYLDGEFAGDLSVITEEKYEQYENVEISRNKLAVCYTETTHHYTDWYRRYGDGSTEYIGTTYEGTTYNEVCEDSGSGGSSGGGGTYNEYTSNTTPDHYLSVNPLVKYPEDSDYEEKYPKLTEYLRNKLPNIASNERIVDAIVKYTDLSREEIKEELQWGEGPIVEIIEVTKICDSCDDNTAGFFNSNKNPNTLFLDIDMVNILENSPNQVMGDAFSFWVGTTILHEFVHYGDAKDGIDYPGEEGKLFEDEVYGQDVTNVNALEILLRNTK